MDGSGTSVIIALIGCVIIMFLINKVTEPYRTVSIPENPYKNRARMLFEHFCHAYQSHKSYDDCIKQVLMYYGLAYQMPDSVQQEFVSLNKSEGVIEKIDSLKGTEEAVGNILIGERIMTNLGRSRHNSEKDYKEFELMRQAASQAALSFAYYYK